MPPDGQALAPFFDDRVIVWLVHGTQKPFMVKAIPDGVRDRESFAANYGRYQMRFVSIDGREHQGPSRQQALQLYEAAIPGADADMIHDVYQLDAVSVYNLLAYSLFFFVIDGQPLHVIACAMACQGGLVPLDVVSVE